MNNLPAVVNQSCPFCKGLVDVCPDGGSCRCGAIYLYGASQEKQLKKVEELAGTDGTRKVSLIPCGKLTFLLASDYKPIPASAGFTQTLSSTNNWDFLCPGYISDRINML